jgi:hypothetical protein
MQIGSDPSRNERAWRRLGFLSRAVGLWVFSASTLASAQTALRAGEELTYSVRWAVLSGAGQIRIAATEQCVDGTPRLSVTTSTETRGLAKGLMAFQANSESVFDGRSGQLLSLRESSIARNKHTHHSVTFDYRNRQAWFTAGPSAEPRALEIPDGDPADLITTLMKTRSWDLRVGESQDVVVSFRDEFYLLTIHAVRTENVRTPLGEFETLVLEPRMEKMAPKGMFKRGANVRVWVTRDMARLPVRFQIDFKVGTGVATLVKYTPPNTVADPFARIAAAE